MTWATAGWVLIVLGILGLGLFAVANPALTWLASRLRPAPRPAPDSAGIQPGLSASLIIAVHDGEDLVGAKLDNALDLEPPPGGLEIIVASDGSGDGTEDVIRSYAERGVKLAAHPEHRGKAFAMNDAVALATGDVLIFSDVDAVLAPDAALRLAGWFGDPDLGGVCGQRVVGEADLDLAQAQKSYVRLDSGIKAWESRLGTLTSNDGKLHALRRELYRPIPPGVTDDLYTALAVAAQGKKFVFDPMAEARVPLPSRDTGHEIERRRRIVPASLRGIFMFPELLRPGAGGLLWFRLWCNKVLRRLTPFFLLMILGGSILAAPESPAALALLLAQAVCYALAAARPALARTRPRGPLYRVSGLAFYFCLGNYGTLLGVLDFIMGRAPTRWTPRKNDARPDPKPKREEQP